jgi:hypothetical protein
LKIPGVTLVAATSPDHFLGHRPIDWADSRRGRAQFKSKAWSPSAKLKGARDGSALNNKYDEPKSMERNDAAVAAVKALVAPSHRWRSLRVVKLSYPRTRPQGGVTGRDMHGGQQLLHPSGN